MLLMTLGYGTLSLFVVSVAAVVGPFVHPFDWYRKRQIRKRLMHLCDRD